MPDNAVAISDTTFRDGHQSLMATRLRTEDLEPIAAQMDQIGFHSMEVWGGATFDAATRFLGEDPWERLRTFKGLITNTPLSMLLRGQSLVGYKTYPDDIVDTFVKRAAYNGIDIFRVFDALNDEWNLTRAAEAVIATGKHLQLTICYSVTNNGRMGGPIYDLNYYVEKAKLFESMGANSLCIKDMAGLLAPYDAFELVSKLKQEISVPLQLHTHYTSGMASMTSLKAIEAGIDVIDCAISPLALRTSQPAVEPLLMALNGTAKDPGLNLDSILELVDYLESMLSKYRTYLENPKSSVIDAKVLSHQIPGGMASNLLSQLREADAIDKLDEVLEEIPQTRKDMGYPPLVTPMSQMIGSQSVSNILFGRYKMISSQVKEYLRGMYGRPPGNIDTTLKDSILKDLPDPSLIEERPANLLAPGLAEAKSQVQDITQNIDDVLIYALYPSTGLRFLNIKHGNEPMPDDMKEGSLYTESNINIKPSNQENRPKKSGSLQTFNVYIDGSHFEVEIDPVKKSVNKTDENYSGDKNDLRNNRPDLNEPEPESVIQLDANNDNNLLAPMPGVLLKYLVEEGQQVSKGDPIAVLEAMKMENTLPSPSDGQVTSTPVNTGDTVIKGDILAVIS